MQASRSSLGDADSRSTFVWTTQVAGVVGDTIGALPSAQRTGVQQRAPEGARSASDKPVSCNALLGGARRVYFCDANAASRTRRFSPTVVAKLREKVPFRRSSSARSTCVNRTRLPSAWTSSKTSRTVSRSSGSTRASILEGKEGIGTGHWLGGCKGFRTSLQRGLRRLPWASRRLD